MPSKENTANADIPDINIPTWFELHLLPYNDVIVTKLQMIGLDVVGLKELEIPHTQIFANHMEFGNNGIIVW